MINYLVAIIWSLVIGIWAGTLFIHCPPASTTIQKEGVQVQVITTGYCNHRPCTVYKHGLTRSGVKAVHGICAADWHVFPRGTLFFIPGYGRCRVEDTGNLVKGHIVDLFFVDIQDAREWGRRTQWITLLQWGEGGV